MAVFHVQGVDLVNPQPTFDSIRQRLRNLRTSMEAGGPRGQRSNRACDFCLQRLRRGTRQARQARLGDAFNDVPQMDLGQTFVNDPTASRSNSVSVSSDPAHGCGGSHGLAMPLNLVASS
jgi:hypothetical protein